jgi:hypothetical protein
MEEGISRIMRVVKALLMLSVAGAFVARPAGAQSFKKGALSAIMQTESAIVPASSSGTVFTTPASGFFIVTQLCSDFTASTLVASCPEDAPPR